MMRPRVDVVVVGGGTAGVSAAIAAADAGATTIVFDASELAPSETADTDTMMSDHRRHTVAARAEVRTETVVWGIFAGYVLGTIGPGGPVEVEARRIILATGAKRVLSPAPGWAEPDIQLALMAECAAGYAHALGGWVPGRTGDLVTSDAGILVAGDCAGLCSREVAIAEGRLAGLSAAVGLGYGSESARTDARMELERLAPERTASAADLVASHVQGNTVQVAPSEAFRDGTSDGRMIEGGPEICACEGVSEAAVVTAVSGGARSLNDVKRRTRAGMGVCQGMLCGRPIAHLIARETGMSLGEIPPMTARPPVRSTRLADLAGVRRTPVFGNQDAGVHSE